jgi:UDP-3-O-[3-hydroxymyristoyl] glucosamine N-acyltransferase
VVGVIAAADVVAGTITIGDVVVYAGSASIYGSPSIGSMAFVSGTNPNIGNLVIADSIATLSPSTSSISGSSVFQ